MKRYKPLLLQVGILILLISIGFFIVEQQKKFVTVDFSKHYAQNKTIEISGFEEGELWQGNFSYDSQRALEGKSSITLSSWYGKENSIQSSKNTVIPPGYTNGYISLYIADKQKLASLQSLSLHLVGDSNKKKEYVLTSEIHVGWNRIPISIPSWKNINQRSFSVVSKPGEIAEVNLDRFWVENTTAYTSDLFSTRGQSLSLRTIGDRTYLFSSSTFLDSYQLVNPSVIKRGELVLSLIPEHAKEMQLSLNGTTMKITGPNMDECLLYEKSDKKSVRKLQTTSGKDNIYVFLKVVVQNNKLAYSLSNNGVDFESCGVIAYSQAKPVRLLLNGSYLIDSYSAEY